MEARLCVVPFIRQTTVQMKVRLAELSCEAGGQQYCIRGWRQDEWGGETRAHTILLIGTITWCFP